MKERINLKKLKINIYLQYPWKFPDSPYYKYLLQSPPKKINYLNVEKQKGVITHKKFFWFSNFLKRNIRRTLNIFNYSIPNAHLTKTQEKYDLIHCAHCLSKNKEKWVTDLESEWQLYLGENKSPSKEKVKKFLENKNCKKILPWTEYTKKEILKEFPKLGPKIEVVYPAVPVQTFKKNKSKKITLLFIARYFQWKGGFEAVEVIDSLTKKYENVQGVVISETPKEIILKYSKNSKIKFLELMPQKEIFEKIYPSSDILIYPGYSDTFGFAYLEAMSFGIPIITCNGKSRKEIIEEGKTGFIVNGESKKEDINEMIKLAEKLIENKKLRDRMSKECLKTIKNGKFSVEKRNKKLERIYEEAIK